MCDKERRKKGALRGEEGRKEGQRGSGNNRGENMAGRIVLGRRKKPRSVN